MKFVSYIKSIAAGISFACLLLWAVNQEVSTVSANAQNSQVWSDVFVSDRQNIHRLVIKRKIRGKVTFDICYVSAAGLSCEFNSFK